MQSYFHCDANIFKKRTARFIGLFIPPLLMAAVIYTVCVLLSLRTLIHEDWLGPAAAVGFAVLLAAALICRILLGLTDRAMRYNSRYTYFEIGLKEMVLSLYAGGYYDGGAERRVVIRRLYLIPLKSLESVETKAGGKVLLKTSADAVRRYEGLSDRFGYSFTDGSLRFSDCFNEESGYKTRAEAVIPALFGSPEKLINAIKEAKERESSLPPPAPYKFKEADFVRKRKLAQKLKKYNDFY